MSSLITSVTSTITFGALVVGQEVYGSTTITFEDGNTRLATWAGHYSHTADSEGEPYHYFTNGNINGVPQVIFGFPVSQLA